MCALRVFVGILWRFLRSHRHIVEEGCEHGHAETLRQMAAYTGIHVRDHARDLGLHACAKAYASAREVMELVVAAETA